MLGIMSSPVTPDPPILICSRCRRPMTFMATLPAVADRPAAHAYQCRPCLRVETIPLPQ
jgi:hypothetical protein